MWAKGKMRYMKKHRPICNNVVSDGVTLFCHRESFRVKYHAPLRPAGGCTSVNIARTRRYLSSSFVLLYPCLLSSFPSCLSENTLYVASESQLILWQDDSTLPATISRITTMRNKAVYTAALVADGWEGAENLKKQLCDGWTDRRTDGRTQKWLIESRVRD